MENNIERTGKYDKTFKALECLIDTEVVCVYTEIGRKTTGKKGILKDVKPYDCIIIDNEPIHFIDNNQAILYIGYTNKKIKAKTKVQTIYRNQDLYEKVSKDPKGYKGFSMTEVGALMSAQEKTLGYSVKKEELERTYPDIGKPKTKLKP